MNPNHKRHLDDIAYQRLLKGPKQTRPQKEVSNLDAIFEELGFTKPPLFNRHSAPRHERRTEFPTGECGKLIYPSERVAKEVKRNRERKGTGGATSLLAYHCRTCKGRHLSSRRTDGLKG